MIDKIQAFPSEIYFFKNRGALNNSKLLDAIYSIQAEDTTGLKKSNIGGWHSHEYLFQDYRFKELIEFIHISFKEVLKDNNYRDKVIGEVDATWAIINRYNNFNVGHVHPNTDWSCCYYPKIPKGDSGKIVFKDPRIAKTMIDHAHLLENYNSVAQHRVLAIEPIEEELIIFPAWLEHEVHPNNTKEDRVAIASNIVLTNYANQY